MTSTRGTHSPLLVGPPTGRLLAASVALALASCGGGSPGSPSAGAGSASESALLAGPSFHLAPLVLEKPSAIDADGSGSSAHFAPLTQTVPAALAGMDTAGLTPEQIRRASSVAAIQSGEELRPNGSSGNQITVYTPAQIRAAYELPALPASLSNLSEAQAAALGSGQTIYLIDAYSSPNVAEDLSTFDSIFGLPSCTVVAITASPHLPLAAPAAGSGCSFSIAYASSSGSVSNAAPSYNSSWAVEIGMDVEWAHATAPMARIVLIEAQGAGLTELAAAVNLASAMGPGVVSMSFGAPEGSYVSSLEPIFEANGKMSYVASTGDSGVGVQWPSVSPSVLAVGGTTLGYSGSGPRSETVWSDTGGGISAYEPQPSYQAAVAVPGVAAGAKTAKRSVADVSFNANPNTGQYLVVTPAGASAASWYSGGGTSIGTPQWAGLLAVANAQRALVGKAPLGEPQSAIYKRIGAVKGLYAGAFLDVTSGRDGSCATCVAVAGYDAPSGLGTPNAGDLLDLFASF